MKHALSALVLSLVVSAPALASAQSLERKGNAIFSAERMMGFTATHVHFEDGPFDAENDWTSFSFGWRQSPSVFDIPRVAFDYTVIDHLSIGGSFGYYSIDADDGADLSGFVLSPRVGYIVQFGRVVGIWPRGGFTYHNGEAPYDNNGLALTLECPFTFAPTEHFAFHVGPTFDIDMFGKAENFGPGNSDVDQSYRTIGLNAGLLGWF
jgi:hypothetical protein